MHAWKKKLVVSQLALACTLAITSQANAANYDTDVYKRQTRAFVISRYNGVNTAFLLAGLTP